MVATYAVVLACLFVLMAAAWLTQRVSGNAGWVDVFWTLGTGLGGAVCALLPAAGGLSARQVLVAVLVLAWSWRLGLYIAVRVATSPHEDVRYQRFRAEWGADYQRRMFRFIIVQAPIAGLLDLAVMLAAHNPQAGRNPRPGGFYGLGAMDLLGAVLLLSSVAGEMLSDRQMRRFRSRPHAKGAVCEDGFWAISRHPNYVFEFLAWFAYPLIAIAGFWPWGLIALCAPATLYFLLVYVSGIPPLEDAMLKSRGDAYRDYQSRVPAFFPRLGLLPGRPEGRPR